jgi:endonuclease G
MKILLLFTLILTSCASLTQVAYELNNVTHIRYHHFEIWNDCNEHGPTKFKYHTKSDTKNLKRLHSFSFDPYQNKNCQQASNKAYGQDYDRGHMVPANHLDHSKLAITQSNYMTNILPQHKNMNRGAWLQTEVITECYRDIEPLTIIGGPIWGNNKENDLFIESHNVRTPDHFWKIIIRGDPENQKTIQWIIPNTKDATRKNLDSYMVSTNTLLETINDYLPLTHYNRNDKLPTSWIIPMGCDRS